MTRRQRLPKGVSEFEKPRGSGKWFLRYRKTGQRAYYFKSKLGSAAFAAELDACRRGVLAPSITPGATRYKPGTVAHTVLLWYSSPEFQNVADSTKRTYRGILDRFCKLHGDKPIAGLERRHIAAILGAMADRKGAANKLLDRLRALLAYAVAIDLRRDNPTIGIKAYRLGADGFHAWTDDEIATFEKRHPVGTKPRLAMALLLYSGQRRSDVVRMGWQHYRDGRLQVRQQKTGAELAIKVRPELAAVLALAPRDNLTFLTTELGAPFTAAGFGNWFRTQCDLAGLPQCSAHGLRKAMGRRLAEGNRTASHIQSVLGHSTLREASKYTRSADQIRLADEAIDGMSTGPKTGTDLATTRTSRQKRKG